jgi:hypothetical protein
MLLDDDCRTVVLEGKVEGGLGRVMAALQREKRNDEGYRVLYNPRVRFTTRLYTCFNVDLRKIRLRYPLPHLMVRSWAPIPRCLCFAQCMGLRIQLDRVFKQLSV